MPRSQDGQPPALVEAACPPLTPLADPSFGATTAKLDAGGGEMRLPLEAWVAVGRATR